MQTQVEIPYQKNYDFGVGVDLATGSPMGKVVNGEITAVDGSAGATTSFEISRIQSTEDLERTLGISVEASGGCGCFSASGRFDFAKRSKIQTSSLFMAINAKVELANRSIDDPTLAPLAAAISSTDAFATRFGNMFVRGIGRGGLFIAVMQINTSNSDESESISAELGGSYGLFSAKAKTKFEDVQKKYHSDIHIAVYHEGGPIDISMDDLTDANQLYVMLQKWLKSFQDDPNANAKPYTVTLAPIAIANGPIPANAADIQHAQDVLMFCARERSGIIDGLNLMEFISQNPSRYDFAAPTTLSDIVRSFNGYQADLDLVAKAASFAIDNVKEAMTPADFAKLRGISFPQGVPPTPMPTMQKGAMDVFAAKGEALASTDPLATILREREPAGPSRRGFDIGMGVWDGNTLPGSGKDKIHDGLSPAEQIGFGSAAAFSMDRNKNIELASKGASIAKTDPLVAKARSNASVLFTLGFDIAAGHFGDVALGGDGSTLEGPGSLAIQNGLSSDGQRGFREAVDLYVKQHHRLI
jgi:hypothetical protein